MARPIAPALSLSITGSIGRTVAYRRQRGVQIAQNYAVPSGTPSSAQLLSREAYAFLHQIFVEYGGAERVLWGLVGAPVRLPGWQSFMKPNIAAARLATSCTALTLMLASGGYAAAPTMTVTPISGGLTISCLTPPPAPRGLAIVMRVYLLIDQAPRGHLLNALLRNNAFLPGYSVTLSNLGHGVTYCVFGFFSDTHQTPPTFSGPSVSTLATTL